MANFEHPASAFSSTILIATSADPEATGGAGHFTHPIRNLTVDDPQRYAIALVDITLTHPGTGSVFVSCNLAALTRVGSQLANSIYRIPNMVAGEHTVEQRGTIVRWIPYGSFNTATDVEIQLTDAFGVTLPATGTTTVTLAIKRM